MTINLAVKIGDIELKNPIILASGTAGYGDDNPSSGDVGAIVTKGLSMKPREGNPPPRIWEASSGVINSIGLENEGVEIFLKDRLPIIQKDKTLVIANIFGETLEEYISVAKSLKGAENVVAIELNVSCPNVDKGGQSFCDSAYNLADLVEAVKSEVYVPLIVKLPPKSNIEGLARSAVSVGADALSLINSCPAMAIDIRERKPVFKKGGGLCGPAIKPIALRHIYDLAKIIKVPLIAGGGIESANDVLQFLMAGATAVTIGSHAMVSPFSPKDIKDEIEKFMLKEGVSDISSLIGVAHG